MCLRTESLVIFGGRYQDLAILAPKYNKIMFLKKASQCTHNENDLEHIPE